MIKKEKGITLVSLVITIAFMLIVSSTVVYVSFDRFEINNYKKMINDIEILKEKVANYYVEYGDLPIIRKSDGKGLLYTYTSLDFQKDSGDNSNYYILDLNVMEGISLNYGKEGFEKPNQSMDVYIINEKTHTIYYVKGVKLEGFVNHWIDGSMNAQDMIPPSEPQIKVISETKNDDGTAYLYRIELEIIPGKDNWSGINRTMYSINNGPEININTLTNNILKITENGTYNILAKSYDNAGNSSQTTIQVKLEESRNEIEGCEHDYSIPYSVAATCTTAGSSGVKCKNCGDKQPLDTFAALGHSYEGWTITVKATCTENGKNVGTCTRCGDEAEETILATGHDLRGTTVYELYLDYAHKQKMVCANNCGYEKWSEPIGCSQYDEVSSNGTVRWYCYCGREWGS